MTERFEQFIKERQFLNNVSPRTLQWYRESFKWLNDEQPDQQALKMFVIRMREHGLKATSCNNRIRAVNAYLNWAESDLRIPKLKEEQRVLPTFNVEEIRKFSQWKPRTRTQKRLQVLISLLADTGCRISEALELRWSDVDFDNLLLTLHGKGSKDRKVPYSFELRRLLFRLKQTSTAKQPAKMQQSTQIVTFSSSTERVFSNASGGSLIRFNVIRDVKLLCKRLGFVAPERTLHAFRHSFATHYLRRGGSVFHLQKCLGHSDLSMTRRYANLNTEDLSAVHEQVSLLTAAKGIR
jgi:integrase/recombinase XerD